MQNPPWSLPLQKDQSISTIHHTLRSTRRRLAVLLIANKSLHKLFTKDEQTEPNQETPESVELSVRDIAKEIVAIEQEIPVKNATGDAYHNVYSSLIQAHLHRLDSIDAINYNPTRKTIQPDHNLLALASVAASTSPLVRLLFKNSTAELYTGGSEPSNSITD